MESSSSPLPLPSPSPSPQLKTFKMNEINKHNNSSSAWIAINNEVYDVTEFLNEHPGGEEILIEASGVDATEAFEDIGHSSDARELMKQYKIGVVHPSDHRMTENIAQYSSGSSATSKFAATTSSADWSRPSEPSPPPSNSFFNSWIVPIAILVAVAVGLQYVAKRYSIFGF